MAAQLSTIRVVLLGDQGTGKSSLIVAAATESFPERAPPVLPPTRLPASSYNDIPLTLIDTSSRKEDWAAVESELLHANVVVITYACDRPATLESIPSKWLALLRKLQVQVPVILVGCKLDLRLQTYTRMDVVMRPIIHENREIETCLECSAKTRTQVSEVFYFAKNAVLNPSAPLFDHSTQVLLPLALRALKRIFMLCDRDKDGALCDEELNAFQVKCFQAPLQPSELDGVKRVVQDKVPTGVNDQGLTLTGFLFLHALFIERGRLETTWTVLRTFGYSDTLELRPDYLSAPSFKHFPDQSVELTEKGLQFLRELFDKFVPDENGGLTDDVLDEIFSTSPRSPWQGKLYESAGEVDKAGNMTRNAFISLWSLMALMEPTETLAQLVYLGLQPEAAAQCLRITRRRKIDQKKQKGQRATVQCFLFGATGSGKSALLSSLIGWDPRVKRSAADPYAANLIPLPKEGDGSSGERPMEAKVLVLREIPEESVTSLTSSSSLGPCDVAAFVYDSSSQESWLRSLGLLEQVAAAGEAGGCPVPCLLVAAKDDLEPHPAIVPHAAKVCSEMGLDAPTPVSTHLGDTGALWQHMLEASERPHLNIPETSEQRSSKHMRLLVQRSLIISATLTAISIGAIVGYRIYLSRQQSSS